MRFYSPLKDQVVSRILAPFYLKVILKNWSKDLKVLLASAIRGRCVKKFTYFVIASYYLLITSFNI